ncbi:thioredoxin-2-like [Thrips palmi]|uniref:Thioredoxin-2-like n=1 Tax=Thrips palmi TaxID=161013 RepID=A0A6P9A5F9_THRPL|nr:thioredoxin-2-like [Thrips palmi]
MAKLLTSAEELTRILDEAGEKLVILDFFATWCAPCKIMAPVLDEMAPDDAALVILKVDINQLEELAEEYGISAMPTFVFLRNKKILGTYVGANVTKFKETIELYKAGAMAKGK